jgi:hypothetical protein
MEMKVKPAPSCSFACALKYKELSIYWQFVKERAKSLIRKTYDTSISDDDKDWRNENDIWKTASHMCD